MKHIKIQIGDSLHTLPLNGDPFLMTIDNGIGENFLINIQTINPLKSEKYIWCREILLEKKLSILVSDGNFNESIPKTITSTGTFTPGLSKLERYRELESILKQRGII